MLDEPLRTEFHKYFSDAQKHMEIILHRYSDMPESLFRKSWMEQDIASHHLWVIGFKLGGLENEDRFDPKTEIFDYYPDADWSRFRFMLKKCGSTTACDVVHDREKACEMLWNLIKNDIPKLKDAVDGMVLELEAPQNLMSM